MKWTEEKLRTLSPKDLRQLYENALKSGLEEAPDLLTLFEVVGIPASTTSVGLDSSIGKKMKAVILSDEGTTNALMAAKNGNAPMAIIDPMLQKALGSDYQSANEATIQAGYLVAKLMRDFEWEVSGKRQNLPEGCVAKTAALYVHVPKKKT